MPTQAANFPLRRAQLRGHIHHVCARAGVPQGLVRQWVGPASEDVTHIYEHWSPSQEKQRILAALPAVMSGAPALPAPLPANDCAAVLAKTREMLSKMTARNWQKIRDELLAVTPVVTDNPGR